MSRIRSHLRSSSARSAPRLSPLSACLAAALGVPLGAGAQQAPAANTGVETVTVTATKRTETLQAVPLSVKALTGDELERRGITTLEEALPGEPGVVFSGGGSALNRNISIRGVNDGGSSSLTQSPVAIYIDDMPTSVVQGNGNVSPALYDIEQVTIIRGPRSTLYGSASLGGTIKIVTRNPSLTQREGWVRLGASKTAKSSDWNSEAVGSLSVPVQKGVAAVGVTVFRNELAGFVDDPALGKDVDRTVTAGGRLSVYAEPDKRWRVSGRLYTQKQDSRSRSFFTPGTDLVITGKAVLEPETDQFNAGNVAVTYKADGFDVVSATSYFDKRASYASDLTGAFAPFNPVFGLPTDTLWVFNGKFNSRVVAQELRMVSAEVTTGLTWSAGLFYSNEKTLNAGETPVPVLGNALGSDSRVDRTQTAVFGELGYKFAGGWSVNTGLRRTNYESDDRISLVQFGVNSQNDAVVKESPTTPHVSLAYTDGRQNYYVQASKGFRVGKTNFPLAIPPGVDFSTPAFVTSDSLWTYEAGAKLSLLENRINLNASVYSTKWDKPQLTLVAPPSVGPFTYVDSLGRLNPGAGIEVKGFEVEVTARPTQALRLSAGMGYSNSTFNRDVIGLDAGGGITPSGTRVAGIPKVTANASVRYDFSLAALPASMGFNLSHVGTYDSGYTVATRRTLGGYTLADLRLSVDVQDFTVTAFVNNLTDARPYVSSFATLPESVATVRPRTVGVVGTYRF